MSDLVHDLNSNEFETEVLQSALPVLVDFWAPWCGPCRRIAPMIDEIAAENAGSVKVVKINTDDNQDLAMKYGVEAIPTLMIFKGGQPVQVLNVVSKARLQELLDQAKA